VQYAAIWGFIFLGAIVAVGLWTDIRQTVAPRQSVMMDGARVEVPRHVDGHYYLTLPSTARRSASWWIPARRSWCSAAAMPNARASTPRR
jgi:hypothetical protein